MSYHIFGLFSSILQSFLLILGFGCAVNKCGDFFKVLEEESDDHFKKAFDKVTSDFMDDFNNSFSSFHLISSNVSKLSVLGYELIIGEKFIKKTKDGKILVNDKNVIFDNYEEKIDKLNEKIKNYKSRLLSMKDNNSIELEISDQEEEEIEEVSAE
jgi:hypothetical protein